MSTALAVHHLACHLQLVAVRTPFGIFREQTSLGCAPLTADWISAIGVIIGVAGAATAAPDAMAMVVGWLGKSARQLTAYLARFVPFMHRGVEVQGPTANVQVSAIGGMVMTGTATLSAEGFAWPSAESADAKAERLREEVLKIHSKIGKVRQEVQQGKQDAIAAVAALQKMTEARMGELATATKEVRAWLEARDRRAARVDARGLAPIAVSIIMTGIPGYLAKIEWLGWIFVLGAPILTAWIGRRVASDSVIAARTPGRADG